MLGPIVVMLVLGLLAPHWVMAGASCDGGPTPLSHVETTSTDNLSTATIHHHLDHEHSHDVGALIALCRELGQVPPPVPLRGAQELPRLPVAFGIDRPPQA